MLDKLSAINDRYKEVEKLISSPDAMSDMKLYVQLSKEYKDLDPIIKAYKEYRDLVGNIAEAKEIDMFNAREEYDDLKLINNVRVKKLNQQIQEQDSLWSLSKKLARQSANSLNGLMERLQIVDLLAKGKDEDGNPNEDAIPWITIFITLLFMAIELTPIFFKMMLIKSPYDYMEDNIKALQKADLGIEEKYEYYDDKEGVQRNLIVHHQSKKLLAEKIKILQTQTELNDLIIEKWKEDEKKHISKNPQDYIERG